MSKVKLTDREILESYITTLSDSKIKEAYQLLRERFDIKRPRIVKLNINGEASNLGRVRLRKGELEKLLKNTSPYKFKWLVSTLHSYLDDLSEKAQYDANLKRRLRQYERTSHYYKLTKGWVAQKYMLEAQANEPSKKNGLDFYAIDTKQQAEEYIKSLPPWLRIDNPEIEYLVAKYPDLVIPQKVSEDIGYDG